MIPAAVRIASAGDLFVGYSGLGPEPREPAVVGSGPTAVRPDFRGRGVATALKFLCLADAQRRGYTVAASRSANPAMIRVNEKLGFRRGRAEVRLVKRLRPAIV
jgi:mycothiol synthase